MGGMSFGFAYALKDAEILGLDIDEKAVETYNLNLSKYRARAEVADVLEWKPRGEYDIIFGGSPCQPFSTANSKKKGERHELFPTLSRFFDIVGELKPKAFLLENVKGAASRKNKPYLEQQLEKVKNDYAVDCRVLNAAFYGVPQRRERLIVIGIRRELGKKPEFPKETHNAKSWVVLKEAIGDLLETTPAVVAGKIELTAYQKKHPPLSLEKPSRTVSSHFAKTSRDALVPVPDHIITEKGGWANGKSDWGSRVMRLESPAYTITEKHRSGQLVPVHGEGSAFRRLTVRECMRIQSFPDWWVFPEGVSVSRKYKLVGEAVPPILAYRLAVALGKSLGLEVNLNPKKEDWQLPYFERAFCC
jgi:DNA (cytosine-5)-methyltransferase 1